MSGSGERPEEAPPRAIEAAPASSPRGRVLSIALRVALATFGIAIIAGLVRHVGPDEVLAALARTAWALPLAFALDGARIACDALSTRLLLGASGRAIPARRLFAAHVVGHGVMNVLPAGRSAAEAVKAALLHRELGAAEAVAMGASNQANTLVSSALFSLASAVAVLLVLEGRVFPIAIGIHAIVLLAAGIGMRVAATNRHVEAFFARRLPRLGAHLGRFAERSRETSIVAWRPVLAMVLGRAMQAIEYGLLARAVGIPVGLLGTLAVQGVNLVAAAIGIVMPGQLGSSEAVFALAAEALHASPASTMTIALTAHVVALAWALIGLVLLALWRGRS